MENPKGQKLCYVQSSNGEDRISSLPDALLHHILGDFFTDEVVRLSLLSTRWKYLWTSIPNLNFSDRPLSRVYLKPDIIQSFQDFVERVVSHHGESNIHNFRLDCSDVYGGSCLDTLISSLSRHKLGELVLRVYHLGWRYKFAFPNFPSLSESLTVLELRFLNVLVPDSICFPYLKDLHFELVALCGDKSTQEVSFSFPVLENFTVIDCCWMEIKSVHIYAPTLKKLILEDSYETELDDTEVKMDVMNLRSLSITELVLHDYCLSYLPSLFEASVDIGYDSQKKCLVKCFTRLNHVKNLTLSDACIENLFSADILNNLQVFSSLISLTVTNRNNAFSAECLINLLCYMPNIECLVIELDDDDEEDDADRSWTWKHETVPQCSLLNLKSVKIMCVKGREKELCLIAFLLVRTLEKMIICFDHLWNAPERKNTILRDLLILPRGSAGTQVIVR